MFVERESVGNVKRTWVNYGLPRDWSSTEQGQVCDCMVGGGGGYVHYYGLCHICIVISSRQTTVLEHNDIVYTMECTLHLAWRKSVQSLQESLAFIAHLKVVLWYEESKL